MGSAVAAIMKAVIEISGAELERKLRDGAVPVLVYFSTSWSGLGQILAPALETLAGEIKDELQVVRLDLDHHPELASRYGVTNVPALLLFSNAMPIAFLDASLSLQQMRARLDGLLADYLSNPSLGGSC
jgi:thioredoxin 1